MGHRRRGGTAPRKADAAARFGLQLDQREGAGSVSARDAPEIVLGMGPMLASNAQGFFTYTPSTNLLYGLREALQMLAEETLDGVFARHKRLAAAARAAVCAWGLEILCRREDERSAGRDDRAAAGRIRRGRAPQDRARTVRPLARHRPGPAEGPCVPDWTHRRFQ
jgi:hypothetical protein